MEPDMQPVGPPDILAAVESVRNGTIAAYVSDFAEVLYYAQVNRGRPHLFS
jgi:ABC-type amino acid transport substrate-binding protein